LPEDTAIGNNGAAGADVNETNMRFFDPYPQYGDGVPISSLAWNHNQMVIATSSGIPTEEFPHDNIVLLSSQSGQKLDAFQHDSEWKQKQQYAQQQDSVHHGSIVNSINFGGKSRYLCIGDEYGAVCLWDLKKKLRVRQFFHKKLGSPDARVGNANGSVVSSPSLQVSLDPTDTFVMSLSPWAMYQYNLRDGQLVAIMEVPKDDEGNSSNDKNMFTAFAISNIEHNICAIGTEGGSVYLYDILNQATIPHSKIQRRHGGAVTGLTFSPDNPNILFSSGTDGVVFVHNKANGTSHKVCGVLNDNGSIESLSLHADGVTCAIGCESGDVYVYDLRYIIDGGQIPATLLASYRASEPINSLCFAPPPKAKDQQQMKPGMQSQMNHQNESTTQQQQPISPTSSKTQVTTATTVESKDKLPKSAQKSSSFSSSSYLTKTSRITNEKISSPPKKVPSFLKAKNSSMQDLLPQSPKSKKNMTDEIREVVREEVENLQDEMEEQFRNLHIDMINQFHQQSQEIENILSTHMTSLHRLTAENQQLREENERLRRGL